MILVVGLGNPGIKYQNTRHNIGFRIIDRLAYLHGSTWKKSPKFLSSIAQNSNIILAKPQTFMNKSGDAIVKIRNFYKLTSRNIWVIHDDIDLPLEKLKIQIGGQSAGHHGIESIIFKTTTMDFVRFRIGIGRPSQAGHNSTENYVLSPFPTPLKDSVETFIEKVALAINIALKDGLEKAMNEFN